MARRQATLKREEGGSLVWGRKKRDQKKITSSEKYDCLSRGYVMLRPLNGTHSEKTPR